ncbi:hypothetical protein [Actinomadura algeriensis]|uniref:DUF11 domain-containing protein n=1 Tax=Actinomadura algeriensis TaxID=1679523 RepID=A0ABR9K4K2_9ACTN|nr:hypothetical protein [Actinomadura algeriensis]MBE1537767.1 hypothetical protein [Actinomadura algeriensis]
MQKFRGLAAVLAAVPLAAVVPGPAQAAPKPQGKRSVAVRTGAPERAVVPGGTYAWSFTVAPKGGKKAARAEFRATLPASLAFVSGKGCEAERREVVCDLGKVKAGEKVKGSFRAKVSGRAVPGREILVRGAVTWGKARAAREFPAARVVEASRMEAAAL